MRITIDKEKHDISFIECENRHGRIFVFCTCGAAMYRLSSDGHDFLVSPKNHDVFLSSPGYYGKTLGPIAGRYDRRQFGSADKEVITHGGANALSFKNFAFVIARHREYTDIIFEYYVNEQGEFAGNHCLYRVTYRVFETKDKIKIIHVIKPSHDTYASLSIHNYYKLGYRDNKGCYVTLHGKEVSTVDEQDYLIKSFSPIKDQFVLDGKKALGTSFYGTDHYGRFGHYIKKVRWPIVFKDNRAKICLRSSYPDVLFYCDSRPVGVTMLNSEKERAYEALVIEPETCPTDKKALFIKKGKLRKRYIEISWRSVNCLASQRIE